MTPRRRLLPLAVTLLLAAPAPAGAQRIPICHATGDPNSPYQRIDVSSEGTIEHIQHLDDIVPAPPDGCPAQVTPDEVDPAYPLPTATAEPDVVPSGPLRPHEPRRRRSGRRCRGSRCAPAGAAAGNLGATATLQSETLPLTGAEVPAIALMGLGFLLAGAGLRLRLGAYPGR